MKADKDAPAHATSQIHCGETTGLILHYYCFLHRKYTKKTSFSSAQCVRNFCIEMKRKLKMNTQNTRSGMYLCVHFQRYLFANVEDMGTKRERFSQKREVAFCHVCCFLLLFLFLRADSSIVRFGRMKFFQAGGCVFCVMKKRFFFYSSVFFFHTGRCFCLKKALKRHYTFSLLSSGRSSYFNTTALSVILLRARKRESESERDDGFFIFFFVLSCARLSSRTTTSQFGFIGV